MKPVAVGCAPGARFAVTFAIGVTKRPAGLRMLSMQSKGSRTSWYKSAEDGLKISPLVETIGKETLKTALAGTGLEGMTAGREGTPTLMGMDGVTTDVEPDGPSSGER